MTYLLREIVWNDDGWASEEPVDIENVADPFNLEELVTSLIDNAEEEVVNMSDDEIRTNSFGLDDMPDPEPVTLDYAAMAQQCQTPIQLDLVAKAARNAGEYAPAAREIAEMDRHIVSRIKAGVKMIKGRAQELVWSPGYYRRMYKLGYREVK